MKTRIYAAPAVKGLNQHCLTCYLERNERLNINIFKCLVSNETNMSNFHPLEVVGRDSGRQLQVGENLHYFI